MFPMYPPLRVAMEDVKKTRRCILAIEPQRHKGKNIGAIVAATTADGIVIIADVTSEPTRWEQRMVEASERFNVDEIVIATAPAGVGLANMAEEMLIHCGCRKRIRQVVRRRNDEIELAARALSGSGMVSHIGPMPDLIREIGEASVSDRQRVDAAILAIGVLAQVPAPAMHYRFGPL